MKPEKPIFWHQGLFLQPQHFQHQDQYFHSLLFPLHRFQHPYFWGVCRLEIREAALGTRFFELAGGEFIFPDGTWTLFPGNAVLQPRSFEKDWIEEDKPFPVYLGLRKKDPAGGNATVLNLPDEVNKAASRFICPADPEEVADLYHKGPSARIQKMSYLLKIFWEKEKAGLDDYFLLPIAHLHREGEEIRLSRNFIPPSVSLLSSEGLLAIVRDIRDQVASRCLQLEEYKRPQEIQAAGLDTSSLVHLFTLRSLNRFLPFLYHWTETPEVHPWAFYGFLRELIGELSTFSARVNALGVLADGTPLLPPYDHLKLGDCYAEAQTLIGELLNELMAGPKHIIHLIRDGQQWKGEIPSEALDPRNVFYLVLKTNEKAEGLVEVIRRMTKISCRETMPVLLTRALPGNPMHHCPQPPPGLPRRSNSFYFRLEQDAPLWKEIQKNRNLCLYWRDAPEDLKGEIIVLREG